MAIRQPKETRQFSWTHHAVEKMRFYGISEQKVRGVVFGPQRKEEGVAPRTVAVMQKSGSMKHPSETWVMYQAVTSRKTATRLTGFHEHKKKIISVWRYPGRSPVQKSIPLHVLEESAEALARANTA